MPFTDAENDHLNAHGLLCAGRAACPSCKKCDSCTYVYPGRPLLDFHSTPTAIEANRFCPACTVWLRSVARQKAEADIAMPAKKTRKS